jgi:hypothetical protein
VAARSAKRTGRRTRPRRHTGQGSLLLADASRRDSRPWEAVSHPRRQPHRCNQRAGPQRAPQQRSEATTARPTSTSSKPHNVPPMVIKSPRTSRSAGTSCCSGYIQRNHRVDGPRRTRRLARRSCVQLDAGRLVNQHLPAGSATRSERRINRRLRFAHYEVPQQVGTKYAAGRYAAGIRQAWNPYVGG